MSESLAAIALFPLTLVRRPKWLTMCRRMASDLSLRTRGAKQGGVELCCPDIVPVLWEHPAFCRMSRLPSARRDV